MARTEWNSDAITRMTEGEWRIFQTVRMDGVEDGIASCHKAISGHEDRMDAVELRCAGRRWQGRVMWAALLASVGLMLERLWAGLRP